jgi:hypothetical protein
MDVGGGGVAGIMVLPFAWINLFPSSGTENGPGTVFSSGQ